VQLAGADQATVASYVNEIHLLTRLRGRDHIVTLFDSYIDRSHGYIYMVHQKLKTCRSPNACANIAHSFHCVLRG